MRWISLPVLALALLLALPAFAARPQNGAKFVGTTSQDRKLTAQVTSDGKGLQLEFDTKYRCNRGPSKTARSTYRNQRPTIKPDGTFEYFKTYKDLAPVPGFKERHTQRQRVSGAFSAGGASVKGRIAQSVTGASGLRCKATVTFTARKT